MKIALIGELSSLNKNLSIGLKRLGHEVDIYADQDGWKKIEGAKHPLSKSGKTFIGKIFGYIFWPLYISFKIKGYDVVQFVSPSLFIRYLNFFLISRIMKQNKKTFLSGAGDCFALEQAYKSGCFRYFIYDENANPYLKKDFWWNEKREKKISLAFDGIIPIAWEYRAMYEGYKNRLNAIPIPMDTDDINYVNNVVKDKIVIFHGLNREGPKGTKYIKAAMERLQEKYPDKVECIIQGHTPLKEYLDLMQRTNIVVDQCRAYGLGVNAVYAMAEGKVVFGGAEPESLEVFGLEETPVINILPDEDDIYCKLERLVLHPELIPELGKKSREMAESFHNCNIVAEQYIKEWTRPDKYRD